MQKHAKLLAPQQQVDRVLDRTGLKQYFEIHSDRETAMASFG
jgi:anti-anti-sigma regulatory factor